MPILNPLAPITYRSVTDILSHFVGTAGDALALTEGLNVDIHSRTHLTVSADLMSSRVGVRYDRDALLARVTIASPDITLDFMVNAVELAEMLSSALDAMAAHEAAIGFDALAVNPRLQDVLARARELVSA